MERVNEKVYPREDCIIGCEEGMQRENMALVASEVGAIAQDILQMARKVDCHLFGKSATDDSEKENAPRCLMDDLERTKANLLMTAEKLRKIIDGIGA